MIDNAALHQAFEVLDHYDRHDLSVLCCFWIYGLPLRDVEHTYLDDVYTTSEINQLANKFCNISNDLMQKGYPGYSSLHDILLCDSRFPLRKSIRRRDIRKISFLSMFSPNLQRADSLIDDLRLALTVSGLPHIDFRRPPFKDNIKNSSQLASPEESTPRRPRSRGFTTSDSTAIIDDYCDINMANWLIKKMAKNEHMRADLIQQVGLSLVTYHRTQRLAKDGRGKSINKQDKYDLILDCCRRAFRKLSRGHKELLFDNPDKLTSDKAYSNRRIVISSTESSKLAQAIWALPDKERLALCKSLNITEMADQVFFSKQDIITASKNKRLLVRALKKLKHNLVSNRHLGIVNDWVRDYRDNFYC